MQVKLKVMQGTHSGKEIRIPISNFVIGRGEKCHLRPASDAISRQHCAIVITENQVAIKDFGSKNGTYVNEQRVEGSCALKSGDQLQVGPLRFEVVVEEGAAKLPKANNVKEVAARTAAGRNDKDMDEISDWLEEGGGVDTGSTTQLDSRVFKLQETQAIQNSETATDISSGDETEANDDKTGRWKKSSKDKDKPGKLPPRPASSDSADSREAAAETLRRFFNRR